LFDSAEIVLEAALLQIMAGQVLRVAVFTKPGAGRERRRPSWLGMAQQAPGPGSDLPRLIRRGVLKRIGGRVTRSVQGNEHGQVAFAAPGLRDLRQRTRANCVQRKQILAA
jgi:hypothetical protein